MPAKSKKQQKAAGMALAAKRGEMSPSDLKGAAKEMYDSMSKKQLKEYAETDRKGLPEEKKEAMFRGFQYEIEKNAVSLGGALRYGGNILKGIGRKFGRTGRQFYGGAKLMRSKGVREGGKQFLKSKGGQQAVKGLGAGAGFFGAGAAGGALVSGRRRRRRRWSLEVLMLEIYDVKVNFYNIKYLTVSWKIKPTTEDISLYTFSVKRAQSPDGPFNEIKTLSEQFVYHDTDINLEHKYREFYYKIRVYETADPSNYLESDFAYLPNKPDVYAAEIIRRNNLLLKNYVGVECYIYIIKTYGQLCANCFDYVKHRRRTSDCPVCFHTSYVGGYFGPIISRVNFNPSQKMIQQSGFEMMPDNTAAWMSNYPPLKPKDVIIENGSRRWRVVEQSQTEKKRIPVHQMLQLSQINRTDIEYQLPYKSLTED